MGICKNCEIICMQKCTSVRSGKNITVDGPWMQVIFLGIREKVRLLGQL